MPIEDLDREQETQGSSDRSFGLTFAAVFGIVGLWPLVFSGGPIRLWAFGLATVFLLAAFFVPRVLAIANRLWMRFGLLLGRIVSPIALGIVFCVGVLPAAVLLKLLRKDPLRLRIEQQAKTYWIERQPPGPDPKTMDQQF